MMSDTKLEVSDARGGPGAILRQAREAKGLEATAVAAMLHLSESKLHALETDDYDALPEPVFVRGYLCNYARLLDEPAAPVLDAYSRINPAMEVGEQPILDSHVAVEVSSKHGVVKVVTAVIAAVLIVLPMIWWWDNLELAAQKIVDTVTMEAEQRAPASEEAEADLAAFIPPPPPGFTQIEDVTEATPAAESQEPEVAALDIKQASEEEAADVGSVIIPLPPSDSETVEAAKLVAEEEVAAAEQPAIAEEPSKPTIKAVIRKPKPEVSAVAGEGTLFEFTESCWVKVRDANNQVILIGEYKKGEKKKLSGRTPYKVVLGNSTAVRVSINGKMANLDRYSSGGVARFTIAGGKIQNP